MVNDILLEEFEVLESIYSSELSKLSENEIAILVEPDDPIDDGADPFILELKVHYLESYPEALPLLSLNVFQGELEDSEVEALIAELQAVGEENIGLAMTFTLVSHLREKLSALIRERAERSVHEEKERERLILEAEEARTRGTPVTVESFKAWKVKFDREMAVKKQRYEDERLRFSSAKEREEWKKIGTRPTGRQLFESNRNLDEDSLMEEGTVSVDISQYDRSQSVEEDEDEEEHVAFSDSD